MTNKKPTTPNPTGPKPTTPKTTGPKSTGAKITGSKTTVKKSKVEPLKAETSSTPKVATSSASSPSSKTKAKPQASSASKAIDTPKKSGGNGFLWLIVLVVILGGAVTMAWPYIGSYVAVQTRPYVQDMRVRLGLSPQPTQTVLATGSDMNDAGPQTLAPEPAPESISKSAPFETKPLTAVETAPAVMPDLSPIPELPPALTPTLASPDFNPALLSRLDQLESKLGSLAGAVPNPAPSPDAQSALIATRELSSLVATLSARLETMDKIVQDLRSQQMGRTSNSVSAQAFVLATSQLRMRLQDDSAFAVELDMVERVAGMDQNAQVLTAISRLRPHAEVGVPSKADLSLRFGAVARDISRATTLSGQSGWLAAVKDSLSGLVTVRRTDPNEMINDVDRALALTEKALQAGDLEKAITVLSVLQGSPGAAAAAWLGDARARFDADTALDALYNQALEAMANVGGA